MMIYENFESCKIITCQSGYTLLQNNCVKNVVCTAGQYNNNGVCTNCPPVLNVLNNQSYDSNCKVTKCAPGYSLSNNNCNNLCTNNLNVNSYDIGCAISNCNTGYMVTLDNNVYKCVCNSVINSTSLDSNCNVTGCASGYVISEDKKKCILDCKTGTILSNGICIKECPIGQISINNICTEYKDEYKFTNCGAEGRLGPTLSQCNTSYQNTNLNGKISMETSRQGIQIWTVPITGRYHIICAGAGIQDDFENCRGIIISSVFDLIEGEKIKILVGQSGNYAKKNIEQYKQYPDSLSSGSGGTFVVKFDDTKTSDIEKNIPLIIAGGGGGKFYGNKYKYYFNNNNFYVKKDFSNASYTTSGQNNIYSTSTTGGINGNGGNISSYKYNAYGGGGFYTDGGNNSTNTIDKYNGISFLNGGNGGKTISTWYYDGGFGGGSASFVSYYIGYNGSGGGYSGGASSGGYGLSNTYYEFGYGGGSYSLNTMEKLGYNDGMGYVNIKYLG